MSVTRLTPMEAKEFLGCSYDMILKMVRLKQLPHFHIGRKVFFIKESLEQWIVDQEKASMQPEHTSIFSQLKLKAK